MKKVMKTIIFIIVLVIVFRAVYSAASSHEVTNAVVGTVKIAFIAAVALVFIYLDIKYGGDD